MHYVIDKEYKMNTVAKILSYIEVPAVQKTAIVGFPILLAVLGLHVIMRRGFGIILF